MEPTTEEIEMMRPHRALVMSLRTALVMRKTELRFVLMTSSQSESFMRNMSVSLVMPALLTKMSTWPYAALISFKTCSTLAESTTSNFMPLPLRAPVKRAEIVSAPLSDVAVPTTVAPASARRCAMAAPMPREAPVTRATLPVRSKPFGSSGTSPPLAERATPTARPSAAPERPSSRPSAKAAGAAAEAGAEAAPRRAAAKVRSMLERPQANPAAANRVGATRPRIVLDSGRHDKENKAAGVRTL
mmetsp:Transcript_87782/g.283470  ORF Transcript_87782/g.283470 Transcript_87782/m.283470 type:complete len:245 (+) Transcript_87782:491-1225(+)